MAGIVGVDTGFFIALSKGEAEAAALFESAGLTASALVLFELRRKLSKDGTPGAVRIIRDVCASMEIAPVTADAALRAGELVESHAVPSTTALVMATYLHVGCAKVYTTDRHFLRLADLGPEIIGLQALSQGNASD